MYLRGLKGCNWLLEFMIVSHMMACDAGREVAEVLVDRYVAVIHTKSCFVFQLKSDVKSVNCELSRASRIVQYIPASRSNLI